MKKVRQNKTPIPSIQNPSQPSSGRLHIHLKDTNWHRSVHIKKRFTNFYENRKNIEQTLSAIMFKLFPFLQDNIQNIYNGSQPHCHRVTNDKINMVAEVYRSIHNRQLDQESEVWSLGAGGGVRLFALITSEENGYVLYPLFIDPHHLIYPSKKHNQKDFKKFRQTIKI